MLTPVPPSDCVRAREVASRRLDGELSELEATGLDAHLRRCPDCRAFAAETSAITDRLRRAPLESPPAHVFERVRRRPASTARLQAAAAVLAVVAAGSSFVLGRVVGRSESTPRLTIATPANLGSAQQDEIEQYLLALLPHHGQSRTPTIGTAVAV
jgi:predicted anti-sigma-YlaC factor YlaD